MTGEPTFLMNEEGGLRGDQGQQGAVFSYVQLEDRVPSDHPLRKVRVLVDGVLRDLDRQFSELYSTTGRPSIPPERLLRALLLQYLYGVRSERLLMEQLDYNLLFRSLSGVGGRRPGVGRDDVHEESGSVAEPGLGGADPGIGGSSGAG